MRTRGIAAFCCVLVWAWALPARGDEPEPEPAPETHTVIFDSQPQGAKVILDGGLESCITPCRLDVTPGEHVVGMEKEGYKAREQSFDLTEQKLVKWKLERYPGRLDITSDPSGLAVRIRGKGVKEVKKTPVEGLELPAGGYTVSLIEKGYAEQEETVTLRAGEGSVVILTALPSHGTLLVRVTDEAGQPDTAAIYVDGKRRKDSGPWHLEPGRHHLKVKQGKKTLAKQKFTLRAGENLVFDVQTEPGGDAE